MPVLITTAEDAIVARVKTLLGFPATPKVRNVETIPAEIDDQTLLSILQKAPGVFVAFTGGADQRPGQTAAVILATFALLVVTNHANGEAARRRGDTTQIGAYEIFETIIPGLNGYNLGDDVGTPAFVRIENLFTPGGDRKGAAMYSVVFQMPLSWPSDVDLSLLTPFQTFDAQYDIPTFETEAERLKWLENPPNYTTSKPDAEDKVNVPQ